jgi:predicted O-methyltransferase YrrM
MSVKGAIRRLLGDSVTGMLDYYRFPAHRAAWGGPFNGQERRRELFAALVKRIKPIAIVETGTHLGTTTEFMAATGIPTYSVDANPRSCGFARARLWRKRHVTVRHGDSRDALRAFLSRPSHSPNGGTILAYLDAHWTDDLPLADELQLIFGECAAAVVIVDDFRVPDDPGYAYDDYGPGKALNAQYIGPVVEAHDLAVFYPSASSQQETGLRRGCSGHTELPQFIDDVCRRAIAGVKPRKYSRGQPMSPRSANDDAPILQPAGEAPHLADVRRVPPVAQRKTK